MKQTLFVQRHEAEWARLEAWLDARERRKRRSKPSKRAKGEPQGLLDTEFPEAYRRVCQQLALARERHYSPDLVDRLNRLSLRGHHILYAAERAGGQQMLRFVSVEFPVLVRHEWRLTLASALLFFVPLVLLLTALQYRPEFIHYLLDAERLREVEEMYDPAAAKIGMREAQTNVAMFAFYIGNNVKIGFQTFATGIVFGLGTLFFLLFNGTLIGAIAGHLTEIGYGERFWSFVSGHSALELMAIVISGAAGLKLGAALITPGRRTRKAALTENARVAVRLMYGSALMFTAAALIEAFWSPHTVFAAELKYGVGAALWALVLAYLLFAGRRVRGA